MSACGIPGCDQVAKRPTMLCSGHLTQRQEINHQLDGVMSANSQIKVANRRLERSVKEARLRGASWAEIGRALGGKSRQYAQRRFGP